MSKTIFNDGNPSLGQLGTPVTAAFLAALQNHRHDGQDQDNSCPMDYAVDTGAANAYVIALTPEMTTHIVGLPVFFKALAANTGASTINLNGLGVKSIKRCDGTALRSGDISAGAICAVAYDGTNYQLVSAMPGTVVTTDFTGNQNLATNGYQKLPGGLIIQWGTVTTAAGTATVTFPIAFPTAAYAATLGLVSGLPVTGIAGIQITSLAGATINTSNSASSAAIAATVYWFAYGK